MSEEDKQTRDYVYLNDVHAANLLALNSANFSEYNMSTGMEASVNNIFQFLKEFTRSNVAEVQGEPKKGEPFRSVPPCQKAKRELGFQPVVFLGEEFRETVVFFRSSSPYKRVV